MYSFVARQPILNLHLRTVAYELFFRNDITNKFPDVSAEFATAQLIADQFLTNSLAKLDGEQLYYVNFPYQMLIDGHAEILPPEKVVIEVLESATPDDLLFDAIKAMKRKGFKFALDDFMMEPQWNRFLPYIDIIKFDLMQSTFEEIENFINNLSHKHLTYLAEKVETHEQYQQGKRIGISLFQGYFFSVPEIIKSKKLINNTSTTIKLLKEVNKPEIDYNRIEELICGDLSLYYKLMRYITNIKYHTRFGINSSTMSFRTMAILLGQKELKRFVSLVSITNGNANKPSELYRMSLIRARFFELLHEHFTRHEDTTEAFLCGLLSLLDAVLDSQLPLLLSQIVLPESINQTLVHNTGKFAPYLTLISDYEQHHWEKLEIDLLYMELSETDFIRMIIDATRWADDIL
ncbi:EAL and HDOD domain-containing protein [Pectobacterium sp. B1J-3]|uniref:EAL and HDOD domain-containing protein n=1 Tax=Pectobacterium sp. B1J-3 TaxID=3385371 RepID=UPI0039066AB2